MEANVGFRFPVSGMPINTKPAANSSVYLFPFSQSQIREPENIDDANLITQVSIGMLKTTQIERDWRR